MTEVSEQQRLGDRIVALTKERDDYILKQKVWEAANDELRSTHIKFKKALQLIVDMGNMTLLGGGDLEPSRAHELGANKAFNQAAEIARSAVDGEANAD